MYITGQLLELALGSRDSGALGTIGWWLLRVGLDVRRVWTGETDAGECSRGVVAIVYSSLSSLHFLGITGL